MNHTRSSSILPGICTLFVALAPALVAQDRAAPRDLSPEVAFPQPFSTISGLRELSDGRLLIADRTERHVSLLDFDAGSVDQIGSVGGGPGEYEIPDRLLPLPGDSSLLVDFGNLRLTRITPDGRLAQSVPILHASGLMIMPTGADSTGRLYFTAQGVVRRTGGRSRSAADSAPIVRWEPATGRFDTVAMQAVTPRRASSIRPRDGRFNAAALHSQPFAPADAWAVARTGRIAIARAMAYRVDWIHPDGQQIRGPRISYRPVRITGAEKEAWAERLSQNTVQVLATDGSRRGGSRTFQVPQPDIDAIDFPDVMPPFPRDAAHVTPEGECWVRRSQPSSERRPLFDVFNHVGERIGQVRLPEGRKLTAFGKGTLYAVRIDADDLQWLERYVR